MHSLIHPPPYPIPPHWPQGWTFHPGLKPYRALKVKNNDLNWTQKIIGSQCNSLWELYVLSCFFPSAYTASHSELVVSSTLFPVTAPYRACYNNRAFMWLGYEQQLSGPFFPRRVAAGTPSEAGGMHSCQWPQPTSLPARPGSAVLLNCKHDLPKEVQLHLVLMYKHFPELKLVPSKQYLLTYATLAVGSICHTMLYSSVFTPGTLPN